MRKPVQCNERRPRPITDGYARQTILQRLRKMSVKKEDITPEMIEIEKAKLEGVRTLREFKKLKKKGG